MIYIKENENFCKYYVRSDSRLICLEKDGTENVILSDISDEFDAVTDGERLHFVLQGSGGELIYLKKEMGTWKKYNILKSRRGIKKIHCLHLAEYENMLCAFYVMEHGGQKLFVKHRFSAESLYEEPEVIGTTKERSDFCFCKANNGIVLHFKDSEGKITRLFTDKKFNITGKEDCHFENEIISMNTLFFDNKLYAICTAKRKNSTALIFFDTKKENEAKIVSFGMAKNCRAEIIADETSVFVQWEENGGIMQSKLIKGTESFSKPKPLSLACTMAGIRQAMAPHHLFSGRCAMYNFLPFIGEISFNKANAYSKGRSNMTPINSKKEQFIPRDNDFVLQRLRSIEESIERMGRSLNEMCLFLDKLTEFKKESEKENFDFIKEETGEKILSGEDIGEINSENVKLFESTDIDSVLPKENAQ